jgi:glycosyltransferase involved in cell wall biosynthesis
MKDGPRKSHTRAGAPPSKLRRRGGPERITMLLENNPYPEDPRVRHEAESLVAAGHAVLVVAPRRKGQPAVDRVNGVQVRRFRAFSSPRLGVLSMLIEYLVAWFALHLAAIRALADGSTVLHLHNPPDMLFTAGAVFRLAGRVVVFDHHDLAPELTLVRFGPGLLERVAKVSERLTFAVASHVLAANQSHAELAQTRGGKASYQVTVVRNGPPARWTRLPIRVRDGRLSFLRIAYLGTIAEQDGLDRIAEILAQVRRKRPGLNVLLTVIGDGDARQEFEAALDEWGVRDCVYMTGWVRADQVPELLQEADVCVDPAPATLLNERSTMIKLMEYLALGKPVVAYDLLETQRTVGDAGVLVQRGDPAAFADALVRLAEDPALRSGLAQMARERAQGLTWECSESALLEAYAGFSGTGIAR